MNDTSGKQQLKVMEWIALRTRRRYLWKAC